MNNIVKLDVDQGGMPDLFVRQEIFDIEERMKEVLESNDL